MPKLFEEQTAKGFAFITATGRVLTYKCNNCSYEFKYNSDLKQKLICAQCGNV